MSYRRSNKLPAMLWQAVKLYAKKHPVLFALVGGLLALFTLGAAWSVASCMLGSGSCRSSCSKQAQLPAADAEDPCPYSSGR